MTIAELKKLMEAAIPGPWQYDIASANPVAILELIERYEKLCERFNTHLDTMTAINKHMGYKFTQPLMEAKRALSQFGPQVPLGEK